MIITFLLVMMSTMTLSKSVCLPNTVNWQSDNFKNTYITQYVPAILNDSTQTCHCSESVSNWFANGTIDKNCNIVCDTCVIYVNSNSHKRHNHHRHKHHKYHKHQSATLPTPPSTLPTPPSTLPTPVTFVPAIDASTLEPTIDASTLEPTIDASTLEPTIDASTLEPTVDTSILEPTIDASTLEPTVDTSVLEPTIDASSLESIIDDNIPLNEDEESVDGF
jgi:hypothetical protein